MCIIYILLFNFYVSLSFQVGVMIVILTHCYIVDTKNSETEIREGWAICPRTQLGPSSVPGTQCRCLKTYNQYTTLFF